MRSPDGQLFDIDATRTGEKPAQTAQPAQPAPGRVPRAVSPPRSVSALLAEVRAALAAEKWDEALTSARVALARDGDNEEALELLRQATEKRQVETIYQAGAAHLAGGRWREALDSFNKVRALAGRYKGVDDLFRQAQGGLTQVVRDEEARMHRKPVQDSSSSPGKWARWKNWIIGGAVAAAALALIAIIGTILGKVHNRDAELAKDGFHPVAEAVEGMLGNDQGETHTVQLEQGVNYRIAGACDKDCTDLDMSVVDPAGNPIASDLERDPLPDISFKVSSPGTYHLGVHMVHCSTAPCNYRYRLYAQVPAESE
jgi:hypothetical protein